MSATPFANCACAIVSGLKDSRSNLISPPSATGPGEQMMGGSPGRRGAPRPTYSATSFRRLDQDSGIMRREREVRIDFEQLANECGNLAAAGVARLDPERAQERQFEHPIVSK